MGCVTPLGADVAEVWRRLVEGHSGIGPITLFDADRFPVRIAAEVRNWDMSDVGEAPAQWRAHPRQTHFAVAAAIKAVRSAGLADAAIDPRRFGVYLGCGETFQDFRQFAQWTCAADNGRFDRGRFLEEALRASASGERFEYEPAVAAGLLAGMFNAQGPNANCTAACVSSSQAIGEAAAVVRRGEADLMLCGGAHSMIHPLGVAAFQLLSVLSDSNELGPKAMRPFDRNRNGFVIGEGGAILVLESLRHARRRGAEIWAKLSGFGSAQDAFRLTDSDPRARGISACIRLALRDANLDAEDIDCVNAHGTATKLNDRVETLAIKQVFGDRAYRIPISSIKGMIGHLTTACGAIETLSSVMTARTGVIPPTINHQTPDPQCDLDYVPNVARQAACKHILNNNFGLGGQNVALVVSRFNGR
jgi:3-oxoacyl-[acyl-carrier-protein] synthase II